MRYSGVTTADESAWDRVQSCKMIDWETVQVAAGAMPAFRIDCTDNYSTSDSQSGTWNWSVTACTDRTIGPVTPMAGTTWIGAIRWHIGNSHTRGAS